MDHIQIYFLHGEEKIIRKYDRHPLGGHGSLKWQAKESDLAKRTQEAKNGSPSPSSLHSLTHLDGSHFPQLNAARSSQL